MNLESLALAVGRIEERVKADIAAEFTRHAYDALAPGNPHRWDSDGFYTARDAVKWLPHGYPMPPGEHEFPVPADCPYWSTAHREGANLIRGFLRHAWLEMPEGDSTGVVAITVHSADVRMRASVGGYVLEPLTPPQKTPELLLWRLGEADPRGVLHLHCDAPVGLSQQLGRVSCLIGKPFWYR